MKWDEVGWRWDEAILDQDLSPRMLWCTSETTHISVTSEVLLSVDLSHV